MKKRLLIAGFGYVGSRLGQFAHENGWHVTALRRSPINDASIQGVSANLLDPHTLRNVPDVDAIVYCASAGESSDAAYEAAYVTGLRNLLHQYATRAIHPGRLVFVSSTGVFAENRGDWVDEDSSTVPTHFSGKRLIEGESIAATAGIESCIVRLSGIYGPGRDRAIRMALANNISDRPTQIEYTNRIHRDDCAGSILHLLHMKEWQKRVFIASDHEPADRFAVQKWIRQCNGLSAPEPLASGPSTGKRCRNTLLLSTGYTFRFPTFREGYGHIMSEARSSPQTHQRGT